MRHLQNIEIVQRGVRQTICTRCPHRPTGSEKLHPDQPRACEPGCSIFLNLPAMAAIAGEHQEQIAGPFERAVRDCVCSHYTASPTAGDYCAEGELVRCPLRLFSTDLAALMDRLAVAHVSV